MITAAKVKAIMLDCLANSRDEYDASPEDFKPVDGILNKFSLHGQRLESHRAEIEELIAELPKTFFPETGGGMSFLELPADHNGRQWGEQRDAEALFVLASGLGLARFLMPREMWLTLPGEMPYIQFDNPQQ